LTPCLAERSPATLTGFNHKLLRQFWQIFQALGRRKQSPRSLKNFREKAGMDKMYKYIWQLL
jgi:hypothetical protein